MRFGGQASWVCAFIENGIDRFPIVSDGGGQFLRCTEIEAIENSQGLKQFVQIPSQNEQFRLRGKEFGFRCHVYHVPFHDSFKRNLRTEFGVTT